MFHILVVEDDAKLRSLFCTVLTNNGYLALPAESGEKALSLLDSEYVDLIISDIMMSGMDGYELIDHLRTSGFTMPILIITAKERFEDKQRGFQAGIDDYMVKPIELDELLMRVRALLRRANIEATHKLTHGNLVLDADAVSAVVDGQEVPVTMREFNILFKLLSYPNKTFTRAQLMDEFWGMESESTLRAVDVYITKLRDKFSGCTGFSIATVRGLGYKAVLK